MFHFVRHYPFKYFRIFNTKLLLSRVLLWIFEENVLMSFLLTVCCTRTCNTTMGISHYNEYEYICIILFIWNSRHEWFKNDFFLSNQRKDHCLVCLDFKKTSLLPKSLGVVHHEICTWYLNKWVREIEDRTKVFVQYSFKIRYPLIKNSLLYFT